MPILFIITAISGSYSDIARNPDMFFFKKKFFILIGIFYPSGEPISPHLLRSGPFAVVHCVITSDRRERGDPLSRAERGDLMIPRQKHEIAKPVASEAWQSSSLLATTAAAILTRE